MFDKEFPTVTVSELKQLNKKKILLIDVRDPGEFQMRHVPNSVNVPAKLLKKQPTDFLVEPAYLICESGGPSKRLAKQFKRKGFDVTWVEGGVAKFAHQYPIVRLQKVELESEQPKKKGLFR